MYQCRQCGHRGQEAGGCPICNIPMDELQNQGTEEMNETAPETQPMPAEQPAEQPEAPEAPEAAPEEQDAPEEPEQ